MEEISTSNHVMIFPEGDCACAMGEIKDYVINADKCSSLKHSSKNKFHGGNLEDIIHNMPPKSDKIAGRNIEPHIAFGRSLSSLAIRFWQPTSEGTQIGAD